MLLIVINFIIIIIMFLRLALDNVGVKELKFIFQNVDFDVDRIITASTQPLLLFNDFVPCR